MDETQLQIRMYRFANTNDHAAYGRPLPSKVSPKSAPDPRKMEAKQSDWLMYLDRLFYGRDRRLDRFS